MKWLLIMFYMMASQAFAAFDCRSQDAYTRNYRVVIQDIVATPQITVYLNGKKIYTRPAVQTLEANGTLTYQSTGFLNKNRAPASLSVSIYKSQNQILGLFSEGSYLPEVPYLQLRCVTLRASM